jgi:hypothetical protein
MKKSQSLHSFTRTTFITTIGVIFGVFVIASCQNPTSSEKKAVSSGKETTSSFSKQADVRPSLALSLSVLQNEVAKKQHPLPDDVAHLGNINRIQGFIIEPDGEIILFGTHDPETPLLHIDDVAVALRNAYQDQLNNTYQGVIGCTIDPLVGAQDPWRIQKVQVFGMPPTATMAARHITIDYELKKVSAGLLSFAGVLSQWEMTRAASPLCEGSSEKQQETTHRFWFYSLYPASPRFVEEEDIVLIVQPVRVQLLTEREFLDRTGQRTGAAPASVHAERFAQMITEMLARNQIHRWASIVQDFRAIEVAQLLRFKHVPIQSLQYFLHDHPLTEVETPTYVGGIRREESGEVVCDSAISERRMVHGISVGSTERVQRYHLTSRGGVEAKVEISEENFEEEHSGALTDLHRRVRASRPSSRALFWSLED